MKAYSKIEFFNHRSIMKKRAISIVALYIDAILATLMLLKSSFA